MLSLYGEAVVDRSCFKGQSRSIRVFTTQFL